jgi:hypothetical protein
LRAAMWSSSTLHVILTPLQTVSLLQSCALLASLSPAGASTSQRLLGGGRWATSARPSPSPDHQVRQLARDSSWLAASLSHAATHGHVPRYTVKQNIFAAYSTQRPHPTLFHITRLLFAALFDTLPRSFEFTLLTPSPRDLNNGLEACCMQVSSDACAAPACGPGRSMQGVVTRPVCGAMRA